MAQQQQQQPSTSAAAPAANARKDIEEIAVEYFRQLSAAKKTFILDASERLQNLSDDTCVALTVDTPPPTNAPNAAPQPTALVKLAIRHRDDHASRDT